SRLADEQSCSRGKSRHARGQRIRNTAPFEPADLLGNGAEHGKIAGMESRHVLPRRVRRDVFGFDLVERHRRSIDQSSAGGTISQQFRPNDRAGIKTDGTSSEEVAATDRNKVRGAGTGADEMNAHDRSSLVASAQVAAPRAMRGTISEAEGPAAASAAASATEETPINASTRSDRVCARGSAASRSARGTRTSGT